MKCVMFMLGVALLLVAAPTLAGPEKVTFPPYQTHVHYTTVDRPDVKEVRDVYAASEVVKGARSGQPLPAGSILTLVHFKAQVDDKGQFVKDPNGRLVKGVLDRIGVMEKRIGWGAEYPDDMRNGEWEYASFRPDGTFNEKANVKPCFQCHKPQSGQDFLFTLRELVNFLK